MFGPTRLYLVARNNADVGLLAATAAVTVLFVGTPFVLDEIASSFDVGVGAAGLVSTAQVGGFGITTFIAGRRLRTARMYLFWGALTASVANALSAIAPNFGVLLVMRTFAGIGAGLLVWLSWARAMRSASGIRTMASVGPLVALVAAPTLSWTAEVAGVEGVFWLMAASFLPAVFLPATFAGFRLDRSRMSPSRSNIVLLVALGVMTLSANGLWVYTAVLGEQEVGLSPLAVSLAFSGNALSGLIATRIPSPPFPPRVWLFGIAVAAALVVFGEDPWLYVVGVLLWGFCFWMATPMLLSAIAAWSLAPEERVGDAQSAMAAGRAIGPAIGGLLIGSGASFVGVGLFTIGGLMVSAVMAYWVAVYRRSHPPPVDRPGSDAGR